ncbi:MAG: DJ-1 family glyoxalase III [Candidatus Kapaibacteriota bacterium]
MEKSIKILVVVADGTEDIEAVVPIDLFRRANFEVVVAGAKEHLVFARGLKIIPDIILENLSDENDFDLVYVPGGAKGVENLGNNSKLGRILQHQKANKRWIAAICAAPLLLDQYNILDADDNVTSHPSIREKLLKYNYSEDEVVVSRKIVTSRGAGTSLAFGLKLIELLGGKDLANKIARDIVYKA